MADSSMNRNTLCGKSMSGSRSCGLSANHPGPCAIVTIGDPEAEREYELRWISYPFHEEPGR